MIFSIKNPVEEKVQVTVGIVLDFGGGDVYGYGRSEKFSIETI